VLWLTTAVDRVSGLSDRSRWLLWLAPGTELAGNVLGRSGRGLTVTRDRPIANQLQAL
jgi:cell division inhibitor SulA